MEMINVPDRHYVRNSIVPFEEDDEHEFKGHRNLAAEELPQFTKATKTKSTSRKSTSRPINGFLNSGKGGTVYLGLTDEGVVCGINLTYFQKEHMLENMADLMSRYKPPVLPHRYCVQFVIVVEPRDSKQDIAKQHAYLKQPPGERPTHLPHRVRTAQMCWCDNDAFARLSQGVLAMDYIVEIIVHPWDPRDPRNVDAIGLFKLHPIHADEEGKIFVRSLGSVRQYTAAEVAKMTRDEVKSKYEQEMKRLKDLLEEQKAKERRQSLPKDGQDQRR